MSKKSDAGYELALTIINDGDGYKHRCRIAKRETTDSALPRAGAMAAASTWLVVALEGARQYERQFGSPGASCFTSADILAAAAELSEYYERHIGEFDAAQLAAI